MIVTKGLGSTIITRGYGRFSKFVASVDYSIRLTVNAFKTIALKVRSYKQ